MDDCGHYRYLQERAASICAANPHAAKRILGAAAVKGKPTKPLIVRPIFPRGRYVPPSIGELIVTVARVANVPIAAVLGDCRKEHLVNVRFAIANLAEEFAPRLSCRAVGDAMNRGDGLCEYYRERHRDRLEQYPDYLRLHSDCVAILRAKAAGEAQ